jgi:hypothetical protein
VDKRFHVPNGSHGPGDYSGANKNELQRMPSLVERVLSLNNEEQVFDDEPESDRNPERDPEKREQDLEAGVSPVTNPSQ